VTSLFDLPFEEPEEAQPPGGGAAAQRRRVYSVSQLTAEIRTLLEASYVEVWVEGEISNCRLWTTGHLYFTLKDQGAQLKAVMFRTAYRLLAFKPEDGLHVTVRGRISVYEPKGEYQIVCEHMEPEGLGALQLAFEQLKKKLQQEGLFAPGRKRPLPVLPRKIGVVTSIDGAALRDIIKVLDRRYRNVHLVIAPARVQGEGAAKEIARALSAVAAVDGVDVVIVGRGGGSAEDLWAFNDERLARVIAGSPVPVISAVGHEVDYTISDFVADHRAPTPSAAAEVVVSRKDEFCARIDRLGGRLAESVRRRIHDLRGRVDRLTARPGLAAFPHRLALKGRRAAELTHALRRAGRGTVARRERRWRSLQAGLEAHDLRRRLGRLRTRLVRGHAALKAAALRGRHRADARLGAVAGRLETLSPLGVLARGYSVCWNEERTAIVRDAAALNVGDTVRVSLHKGEIECGVRATRPGKTE
jgi:exodeoxyribonuclease VII large subunit